MSAKLFWTLPAGVHGDAPPRRAPRVVHDPRGGHFNHYDAAFQVARAAESAGFDGVLIPWQASAEDPWIVAAALARETSRLTFLPELQVNFATPVYLAKMSVSFQRLSHGRLAWHFALDGDAALRRAHGDFVDGADWYARASEYLEAAKGVSSQHPYDFRGRFYDVEKGGFEGPLAGVPVPRIHTSGVSDAALQVAGKFSDVHVLSAAGREHVARELGRLKQAAAAAGRQVASALRLGVISRPSAEEADEAVREAGDSAPGGRLAAGLEVAPGIWSGFERLGYASEFGLVGSHAAVAAELEAYLELGVDTLILSGRPELREAYQLGEHVLPRLDSRQRAGAAIARAHETKVA